MTTSSDPPKQTTGALPRWTLVVLIGVVLFLVSLVPATLFVLSKPWAKRPQVGFVGEVWRARDMVRRGEMVYSLHDLGLQGKSRDALHDILGEPDMTLGGDDLYYFDNGGVSESSRGMVIITYRDDRVEFLSIQSQGRPPRLATDSATVSPEPDSSTVEPPADLFQEPDLPELPE